MSLTIKVGLKHQIFTSFNGALSYRNDRVKEQERGQKLSGRNVENREIVDDGMHPLNQNAGNEHKGPDNVQQQKASGYFRGYKGSTMTIVFHALLSPHFMFEQSEGEKIFMWFGGINFEGFNENVVEAFPEQ